LHKYTDPHGDNYVPSLFSAKENDLKTCSLTEVVRLYRQGLISYLTVQDVVPGMEDPVVYIGVVEKGWAMLELTVKGVQGHSSMPPK
jgi:hypothetical protein